MMMLPQRDPLQKLTDEVNRALKECAKWETTRRRGELLDGVAHVVSHQFDRAATYSTVIIAAGYAGFFAAWTTLGAESHPRLHAAAGLIAVLSLLIFIAWEVFKMTQIGIVTSRVVPLLDAEPLNAQNNFERISRCLRNHNLWLARIWPWALVLTLIPAIAAAILLISLFAAHIFSPSEPALAANEAAFEVENAGSSAVEE